MSVPYTKILEELVKLVDVRVRVRFVPGTSLWRTMLTFSSTVSILLGFALFVEFRSWSASTVMV